jgi:transposase-like protein
MPNMRREFSPEFRREAVALLESSGLSGAGRAQVIRASLLASATITVLRWHRASKPRS